MTIGWFNWIERSKVKRWPICNFWGMKYEVNNVLNSIAPYGGSIAYLDCPLVSITISLWARDWLCYSLFNGVRISFPTKWWINEGDYIFGKTFELGYYITMYELLRKP